MPDANLLCGTKESCTHGMYTSATSSFLRPFKENPHREGNTRPRKNKKKKKKQPSTRAELQSSLHHGDSFLHPVNFRNEERDKNRTLLIRRRKSFERLNCVCVTFSFWRIFIKIVKIDREYCYEDFFIFF